MICGNQDGNMGQSDVRKNISNQEKHTALHGRSSSRFNYSSVSSLFDMRVFYVRLMSCLVDETPDLLTMWFPTRSIGIALEVNGGRIAPAEQASLALRRDRVAMASEEVTYVSTDNLRTSGSLVFEIYDKQEFLVSGSIKQAREGTSLEGADTLGVFSSGRKSGWKMECSCELGTSKSSFFRIKHEYFSRHGECSKLLHMSTCMEMCVVGRYLGSPVILTQTVQLHARRSRLRCAVLDAIPEDEECSKSRESFVLGSVQDQLSGQYSDAVGDSAEAEAAAAAAAGFSKLYESEGGEGVGYGEGEDGEVSWFNAGVRVGVGIGLGMCLGVGIGVGLLVRTYNATARSFRRGIL